MRVKVLHSPHTMLTHMAICACHGQIALLLVYLGSRLSCPDPTHRALHLAPSEHSARMRTRVTVLRLFVCLFVCNLSVCLLYQSPGFYSRLYDKFDIPACSSLVLSMGRRARFQSWAMGQGQSKVCA